MALTLHISGDHISEPQWCDLRARSLQYAGPVLASATKHGVLTATPVDGVAGPTVRLSGTLHSEYGHSLFPSLQSVKLDRL